MKITQNDAGDEVTVVMSAADARLTRRALTLLRTLMNELESYPDKQDALLDWLDGNAGR